MKSQNKLSKSALKMLDKQNKALKRLEESKNHLADIEAAIASGINIAFSAISPGNYHVRLPLVFQPPKSLAR